MKGASMKHNYVRYSMIVLLIGSSALTAGGANARDNEKHMELLSSPYGIAYGQTARGMVVCLGDGSVRFLSESITARFQLLDTEGEVIAQSDEIRVAPGQTRFWDVPRETLARGEPTGRILVRARIVVSTRSPDSNLSFLATWEVFDSSTGVTASITTEFSHAAFRF